MLRWGARYGHADRAHLTPTGPTPARLAQLRVASHRWLRLIALVGLAGACGDKSPVSISGTTSNTAVVVAVTDGDTLSIDLAGKRETVRLIGLDTPETKHPTKGVQCFGPEATEFTASVLAVGTQIELTRDVEARDRYGRLLAYVRLAGSGVFVNLELVRLGFARPYPFPPNTAHQSDFAAAAWEAQQERRGLWRACPHG